MDPTVVKRAKRAWAVAWACVTGLALVGWGVEAAAAAAAAFAGASVLAVTAFVLYLLLGDAPVLWRVLLIAAVLVGLIVEVGALVAGVGWLLRGVAG
ncbi:MAG TPA: hypothetical protein VGF55_05470 [Gemmataceae bacterium]|jgi:hypothetical protein